MQDQEVRLNHHSAVLLGLFSSDCRRKYPRYSSAILFLFGTESKDTIQGRKDYCDYAILAQMYGLAI